MLLTSLNKSVPPNFWIEASKYELPNVLPAHGANTSRYHIHAHTTLITPYTMLFRCIAIHTFVHALWLFQSPFINSIFNYVMI